MSDPIGQPVHGPQSYAFPKSAEGLLPWSHVVERLSQARYYWLGTVRPDGRPHVTPLWGAWVDGVLYLDGSPRTQWARNLATHPAVTMHLESGNDVVILEGVAEDLPTVSDDDLARRIVADWDHKYGRLHPDPARNGIFRITPHTVRAWSSEDLTDATSWQLG